MGNNPRRGYVTSQGMRVLTVPWGHWYWDEKEHTISYVPAHMKQPAIRLTLTGPNTIHEAIRRACAQAVTWQEELKPILTKEEREA